MPFICFCWSRRKQYFELQKRSICQIFRTHSASQRACGWTSWRRRRNNRNYREKIWHCFSAHEQWQQNPSKCLVCSANNYGALSWKDQSVLPKDVTISPSGIISEGWEEKTQFVIPVGLEMPEEILPYVKKIRASLLVGKWEKKEGKTRMSENKNIEQL